MGYKTSQNMAQGACKERCTNSSAGDRSLYSSRHRRQPCRTHTAPARCREVRDHGTVRVKNGAGGTENSDRLG